jgi:transcriptional regulator with GAF, ATPase, and Fis domain
MGRRIEPFSGDAVRSLKAYDWPGNVRELQNVVERAVIMSRSGRLVLSQALPESARPPGEEPPTVGETPRVLTDSELRHLERRNILLALETAGWRVSGSRGAARLLEISPSTLASRMKALGIARSAGS